MYDASSCAYDGANRYVYKYTGKERDSESGLDNLGARYYESNIGRLMTVDPLAISKDKMLDPQQLNAYAYTRGNPLRFVDSDGQIVTLANLSDNERNQLIEQLQKQTGLKLKYNSKTGNLDVVSDPSKAGGASKTFRDGLLGAINSKETFKVINATHYQGMANDVGLYDDKTRTVALNFKNINDVEEKHPEDFNLGTILYHELVAHGIEGLPDERGFFSLFATTATERENDVRRELGMYLRGGWTSGHCEKGTCTIWLYKNLDNGITDNHIVQIPVSEKKDW